MKAQYVDDANHKKLTIVNNVLYNSKNIIAISYARGQSMIAGTECGIVLIESF